jgi:hypothetical protein
MLDQVVSLDDGSKVNVKVEKSACGRGIVICQQITQADGTILSVQCSGTCNGQTINWTCPAGKNCRLDCTGSSPRGSCV